VPDGGLVQISLLGTNKNGWLQRALSFLNESEKKDKVAAYSCGAAMVFHHLPYLERSHSFNDSSHFRDYIF